MSAPSGWPLLRAALITGACGSVASSLVLMACGRAQVGSATAPTNATSQWLWGRRARRVHQPTLRHTVPGYLIHHASATMWAGLHAAVRQRRRSGTGWPVLLGEAAATAALACLIDYTITPPRLRPGFEHHLSRGAMLLAYLGFAGGLALGARWASSYDDALPPPRQGGSGP